MNENEINHEKRSASMWRENEIGEIQREFLVKLQRFVFFVLFLNDRQEIQ